MKILVVVDHAVGISGPHRNVVGSLNALGNRNDVEVTLLTGRIDPEEPYATAANIKTMPGFFPKNRRKVLHNLRLIWQAARGTDLIYVPTNLTSFLYAQTVRRGRKLVAGPNVTPLPLPHRRHDSPGMVELRLMSDAWFELSLMRRDHVRRESGNASVSYIHHAIDSIKFSPAHSNGALRAELGLLPETTCILYVGRDNKIRKGVSQLLDAIDTLDRSGRGNEIHLALVGKMSEATVERAKSMDNVTLLGFRTGADLATLYASADISVVPSSWESFGFTVLEAMASGRPVVAGRTGSIPELIVDGETGVLVDIIGQDGHHRPDAGAILADAIGELVADPERRARLGQNARQRARTAFSEDRLGSDLISLFQDVIDK